MPAAAAVSVSKYLYGVIRYIVPYACITCNSGLVRHRHHPTAPSDGLNDNHQSHVMKVLDLTKYFVLNPLRFIHPVQSLN